MSTLFRRAFKTSLACQSVLKHSKITTCPRGHCYLLSGVQCRVRSLPSCSSGQLFQPEPRRLSTENNQEITDIKYAEVADETLESLTEKFEDIGETIECHPDYDVTYGSGVLTVCINPTWGTYVINKQAPNKQIWLSSPISGPKRYDYDNGRWIYRHDGGVLHELLTKELTEAFGTPMDFKECSFGGDR